MTTSTKLLMLNYLCHFIFGALLTILGIGILKNPATYLILVLYVIMLQVLGCIIGYEKAKEEARSEVSSSSPSQRK